MKNDPTFKFVAAIILAGVIVALVSPSHAPKASHTADVEAPAQAAAATE